MSAARPWLAADRDPDATALVMEGRAITRSALARHADALAHWLGEEGVAAGDVVAALLPNGVPFVALLHAVDRRSAVLLPLNTRLTVRELVHPLRETRARILLHDGGALSAAAEDAGRLAGRIAVRPVPERRTDAPAPVVAPRSPDAALAILYTSGTTGRAKGAVLSHAAFRASATASAQHLGAHPEDRWLACMPLLHVGGLSILLRCALQAVPVVLHARFDPKAVSESLDADGITMLSLVPSVLERLLRARGRRPAPPKLRCVLLGGGPASPKLLERAAALGYPLAPTYGLTEAASQVATQRPGGDPLRDGLEPLPGTQLRIMARDGSPAAAGEPGEILVRAATLMTGYVERPEETRAAIRDGWLYTGDVGRLDRRGRLHLLDRRSDLIVSGGENIYPAEVEAALCEHPAVLEAAVAPVPDPEFGSRPAAWLVLSAGSRISAAELNRFCGERLAGYKIPVRYHCAERLPRTASGKLQRALLREGLQPAAQPSPSPDPSGSP